MAKAKRRLSKAADELAAARAALAAAKARVKELQAKIAEAEARLVANRRTHDKLLSRKQKLAAFYSLPVLKMAIDNQNQLLVDHCVEAISRWEVFRDLMSEPLLFTMIKDYPVIMRLLWTSAIQRLDGELTANTAVIDDDDI